VTGEGSVVAPTVRFGRRQSKGVLLGFSGIRLITIGAAIAVVVMSMFTLADTGLLLSAPIWAGLLAGAFVRWNGDPLVEALPTLLHWGTRTALRQNRYRIRLHAPRPAGSLALPGDAASLRFYVDPSTGHLVHLVGSERSLPGGAGSSPAEVAFAPDGDTLVVTEKTTNKIDTWRVNDKGYAEDGMVADSSGATPFGFDFGRGGVVVVSEAGPGAVSSYEVEDEEPLELLTASLSDTQKADCWVVVTRGRFAFTTNTGSGSISSYQIVRDGYLTLRNPVAANTGKGTAPVDMALSADGRFLYAREATQGVVDGFRVGRDGSLTLVTSAKGVPAGAQGVAAR